jgi:hypothetical protein
MEVTIMRDSGGQLLFAGITTLRWLISNKSFGHHGNEGGRQCDHKIQTNFSKAPTSTQIN